MEKNDIGANAVVNVTLQIKVPSTWSGDTTAQQIFNQAQDDAKQMLDKKFGGDPNFAMVSMAVTSILAEK